MPYLLCENCGGYYPIPEDATPNNFDCHKCGGQLNFIENLHESLGKEKTIKVAVSISRSFYRKVSWAGLFLGVMGIVLHYYTAIQPFLGVNDFLKHVDGGFNFLTPLFIFSIILMITGFSLFLWGNRKHGEIRRMENQSSFENLSQLSSSYSIFNQVKTRGCKKLPQVIVGPTGIFIIHNLPFKNHLIVNGNRWYYQKGSRRIPIMVNSVEQIKNSVVELKAALDSQHIPVEINYIIPILLLKNNDYSVEKEPLDYHIISSSNLADFIVNQRINISTAVLKRTVDLLKYLT